MNHNHQQIAKADCSQIIELQRIKDALIVLDNIQEAALAHPSLTRCRRILINFLADVISEGGNHQDSTSSLAEIPFEELLHLGRALITATSPVQGCNEQGSTVQIHALAHALPADMPTDRHHPQRPSGWRDFNTVTIRYVYPGLPGDTALRLRNLNLKEAEGYPAWKTGFVMASNAGAPHTNEVRPLLLWIQQQLLAKAGPCTGPGTINWVELTLSGDPGRYREMLGLFDHRIDRILRYGCGISRVDPIERIVYCHDVNCARDHGRRLFEESDLPAWYPQRGEVGPLETIIDNSLPTRCHHVHRISELVINNLCDQALIVGDHLIAEVIHLLITSGRYRYYTSLAHAIGITDKTVRSMVLEVESFAENSRRLESNTRLRCLEFIAHYFNLKRNREGLKEDYDIPESRFVIEVNRAIAHLRYTVNARNSDG